jgi:hypothetical protein
MDHLTDRDSLDGARAPEGRQVDGIEMKPASEYPGTAATVSDRVPGRGV